MLRNDITIQTLEQFQILELRGEKYEREGMQWEAEAYFEAYFALSHELHGMTSAQAAGLRDFVAECDEDGELMEFKGYTMLRDGTLYAEAEDYLVGAIHMVVQRDGVSQTF